MLLSEVIQAGSQRNTVLLLRSYTHVQMEIPIGQVNLKKCRRGKLMYCAKNELWKDLRNDLSYEYILH